MRTPRVQAISVKALALITGISSWLLMVSLMGCASDRYNPSTVYRIDDNRAAERGDNPSMDQRIEDSRTAERVREALAAGADYRYDGVKVIVHSGVVELSGFVNTGAHRNRAGEVTNKVEGVKGVENNLTVRD
ncbi:MAG TPA: BON domain-containing protein [Candidatus Limnocylindrales bacterium]|nr:BON domain-containing protein [Candidatus Limnocylindrales bacterium]